MGQKGSGWWIFRAPVGYQCASQQSRINYELDIALTSVKLWIIKFDLNNFSKNLSHLTSFDSITRLVFRVDRKNILLVQVCYNFRVINFRIFHNVIWHFRILDIVHHIISVDIYRVWM
jgi:hypothetical protein